MGLPDVSGSGIGGEEAGLTDFLDSGIPKKPYR